MAIAVTECAKFVVICIIIIIYSWKLFFLSIACLVPSIVVTRVAIGWMMSSGEMSQKAKAGMSNAAEESISNAKTVKAFAEEQGHIDRFDKTNWEVFDHGRARAYFWAAFFMS